MVAPRCDQRRNYEKPLSDHSAGIGAARWRLQERLEYVPFRVLAAP